MVVKKKNTELKGSNAPKTKQEAVYAGIPPKMEKVTEELSCDLNPVEWGARAQELGDANTELTRQEERKKSVTAELNADVKAAQARVRKLSNIVSTHREQREVTVEVLYDYEKGLVTKRRTDTNEVIHSREMTTSERQGSLEFADANDVIESRHED